MCLRVMAVKLDYLFSSFVFIRRGAISVTMYNFGSPRVGNKKFAELYNEVIKIDIIFKYFSQLFIFFHRILHKYSCFYSMAPLFVLK